ncbi:hypothetical protein ATCC51561_1877 [Campylobacter concisus ATCC 51561]|nr:hypothetical protein ATCC51561_1877 [Campylobacter concisus ATCC 51561]
MSAIEKFMTKFRDIKSPLTLVKFKYHKQDYSATFASG